MAKTYGPAPYGVGTPAVLPTSSGRVLTVLGTGEQSGARLIDPITRDYVIDANGRCVGMDAVQQLVYLAVATSKGTSAMRSLGQELKQIKRITSNFEKRVDETLRAAVQHIVDRGLIEYVGTSVRIVEKPGGKLASIHLRWRDVSTGKEDTTFVGESQG